MKTRKMFMGVYATSVAIFLLSLCEQIGAMSGFIDGRTTPVYFDTQVDFTFTASAVGNVAFRQGFIVRPGKILYLDITQPVNGDIDLQKTGTLCLDNDVHIASENNLGFKGGYISASSPFLTLHFDNEVIIQDAVKFFSYWIYLNMHNNVLSFEPSKNIGSGWNDVRGIVCDSNLGVLIKNANIIYPSDYRVVGAGYDYYVPVFRVTNKAATSSSYFNFTDCNFFLDGNMTFTIPYLFEMYDDVQFFPVGKNLGSFTIGGSSVFEGYNRAGRLSFNENVTLNLNNIGTTLNPNLLSFFFNNANLQTDTDFSFAQSYLQINGKVEFKAARPGKIIYWGDGGSANDTSVLIEPGAKLTIGNDLVLRYQNGH